MLPVQCEHLDPLVPKYDGKSVIKHVKIRQAPNRNVYLCLKPMMCMYCFHII